MPTIHHLGFDQYLTNEELEELLLDLVAAYPTLVSLTDIGRTHHNRPIWALTITSPEKGAPESKVGFYIDACIHPEEYSTTSVAIYTAWKLLSSYGNDPAITRLLDEQVFYILPRLNPDGVHIVQKIPNYEWMGNGRYLPGNEQFGPGLHYADIDGDGEILHMRVRDDGGEWKISTSDSRLMVPRTPDEYGGEYYRIYPEGMLVDWDGGHIAVPRPQDGNLNRNFPSGWVPESQQYGSGILPMSEPETTAVVNFILAHPNIAGMQSYHTHGGVILRPWMTQPDSGFKGDDQRLYEAIGRLGVEETGYPLISVYEDFTKDKTKVRRGSFIDWTFGALGIPTFSTELWDPFKAAGIDRSDHFSGRQNSEEDNLKMLRWQDEAHGGEGFVRWRPFDHPQLGPVEIGGWRHVRVLRNPPPGPILEEMVEQNSQFTLRHAGAAPHLVVRDAEVQSIGGRHIIVSATVENVGYLPTNLSAQAIAMRVADPIHAVVDVPDNVRVVGNTAIEVIHLAGRGSRPHPYGRFYDWPVSSQRVCWTLERTTEQDDVELRIRAWSTRAGTAYCSVILK